MKFNLHLLQLARADGKFVSLVWSPAHCDIRGNEAVDIDAKNATNIRPLNFCCPNDFKPLFEGNLKSAWQCPLNPGPLVTGKPVLRKSY